MTRDHDILHAQRPTLHETRGEAHLLVWGGLAQWMVVDGELLAFLAWFDGRRTVREVLEAHAGARGKRVREVRREVRPILRELCERKILSRDPVPSAPQPETPTIANLTVNLTNRCNLHCAWCYNAGRITEEMPVVALMESVAAGREILDSGASFIILGGEPLLDPERLLYALDAAGDLFTPAPLVSTNGTLLTPALVAELCRRRVEVQVSLDSHDPAQHDAFRGAGVFARATDGVRRLVDAGVYTILSMVYTRYSAHEFEAYLDMALALGVDEARFIPMRMIGRGDGYRDLRPDQAEAFGNLVAVLRRRPELRRLVRRDFFTILAAVCRFSTPRTGCGIARKVLFIDADGQVYPCPNHVRPDLVCGDLRREGLAAIFRNAPVLQTLRTRYQVGAYTRCKTCAFRYWCAGDCRGEVVAVTGDPAAPSPHCKALRRVMTEIFWLIAEDKLPLGSAPRLPDGKAPADAFLG